MLVQEQEPRPGERGHEEGQGLALAARQGTDAGAEPRLQAEPDLGETPPEGRAPRPGHRPAKAPRPAAPGGHGQVLLDGHGRAGALARVLGDPPDRASPLVDGHPGDVLARELDPTAIG